MNKRRLPQGLRQRVRNYERQCWAAMRGVDECQLIKNLPEGLRRDIKYHLCLGLVRQVRLPNFDYIFLFLTLDIRGGNEDHLNIFLTMLKA